MTFGKRLFSWLRATLRRSRMESNMDAELRFHIEACANDLIAQGVRREEAERQARFAFGGIEHTKEKCREAIGVEVLTAFFRDLRFGSRILGKNPGFSLVILGSLALGIAANTTVFSIVDGLFLRPWPVRAPERIVNVGTGRTKEPGFGASSYSDYLDIAQAAAFSDAVAYGLRGGYISGQSQGADVDVEVVSSNYFAALGVTPLMGRAFAPQPERRAEEGHSVIVSYRLWQGYFHGDPGLPGKSTLLDGQQFTVIGIAPRDFCGLRRGWSPGIWVTTDGWITMVPGEASLYTERDYRWLQIAARLRPGASIGEARAQLQTVTSRLALDSAATNRDIVFAVRLPSDQAGKEANLAIYLMAMVALVLLISCANVTSLLLTQTERRKREMAMRKALGAGRSRLICQLLSEGLLLSLTAGTGGVLLASLLMQVVPAILPWVAVTNLRLDSRVLMFTACISILMTLVFGIAPAVRAAQSSLTAVIKGDDSVSAHMRRRLPLRTWIAGGEITLSVVLLASSALLLRSLIYSQQIQPGFDTRKSVLMLSVAPPMLYGYSEGQAASLFTTLTERLESMPGVVRASYARRPPLTAMETGETRTVSIPGVSGLPEAERWKIRYNIVAPKFFATVGTRIQRGREFAPLDTPSQAPVVIVNEALARKFWPGQDPVGRSIQVGKRSCRIVGVVETGKYVSLHEPEQPYLFLPFTQVFSFESVMFIETAGDPAAFAPAILKATTAVDQHLPIVGAVTMRAYMRELLDEQRSIATLLGALSILGMLLATAGLYASVAYMVDRRTHEIGVRMAMGARQSDVLRLVLGQTMGLGAGGAIVGIAGAFAASHLISGFIHGIAPGDPLSYAGSALIVSAVALLASYLPARRATRVDPTIALRHE